MNLKKQFMEGLLTQNPVLVQVLGMCSTMAITTSFFNGLGMGVAVIVILTLSNVIIAATVSYTHLVMVAGYALYDAFLAGSLAVGMTGVPGNIVQGAFGAAASTLLCLALRRSGYVRRAFPRL